MQKQNLYDEYNDPGTEEVYIDTEKGELTEASELTPWQKIQLAAKQYGFDVHNPSPGCKKCGGRGYTSLHYESKMPNACGCIFSKQSRAAMEIQNNMPVIKPNRAMRRRMDKSTRKKGNVNKKKSRKK